MVEDGIEDVSSSISARLLRRRSGGGDSTSRWVDGSEVDSESPLWSLVDDENRSEGHGSGRRRLPVKKANRVDSFDVEAMVISGSHGHHDKEVSIWQTLGLAFQTLGVVNNISGTVPESLKSCASLQVFDISKNNFSDVLLMDTLLNLSSLKILMLAFNNFVGVGRNHSDGSRKEDWLVTDYAIHQLQGTFFHCWKEAHFRGNNVHY
ncbi:hypothetical protein L1887_03386 [Cichorium endivia]|nr:hypothetical protein L1887_03386 [Cichorium endivia]